MSDVSEVLRLIEELPESEQKQVFSALRQKIPIHQMEKTLMAPAETILEAIARSSDLTVRGIEGIIAESSFAVEIVPTLAGLAAQPIFGDQAYDFLLADQVGQVRVQVKMQRRKTRLPLRASDVQKSRNWPSDHFVVETQRTRAGTSSEGTSTRPYRFGSFDILAVSMGASQRRWSAFMYTVERWLLPAADPTCLLTYQPVPAARSDFWTDDFAECLRWFRSGIDKRIPG